jgi:NAD+ synthase (glutamine-hydrolysing)
MNISIVQFNPTLGDFKANQTAILKHLSDCNENNSDLVVFSECALFGYYPADLLERESIVDEQLKYFDQLVKKAPAQISFLIGYVSRNNKKQGKKFLNSVALVQKNKVVKTFSKTLLPTYDIFDEGRHFGTGDLSKNYFKFKGLNILVSICEDIWAWGIQNGRSSYPSNPFLNLKIKPDLHINLSASPFTTTKSEQRSKVFKLTTKATKSPMIYVNQIGSQDETIFDGSSCLINKTGNIIHQLPSFSESTFTFNCDSFLGGKKLAYDKTLNPEVRTTSTATLLTKSSESVVIKNGPKGKKNLSVKFKEIQLIHDALILGLKDFFKKTGFQKAHLGLSGGVDSALVYVLACKALGSENVTPIALPTKFNAKLSYDLANTLAENMNNQLLNFPIENIFNEFKSNIDEKFNIKNFGLVHENLQARIRADILMAFSNHTNSMLLSTSNKTEMAVGYTTLYGDMCGGLAPIGDLTKTQVYKLCEYINRNSEIIPFKILTRAPSAELRENQKDQDSLPEYNILDASVVKLVQRSEKATSKVDIWALNALMKSEFKRWQAPPVLKITDHAFGRGRRFPIAHKAFY